MGYRVIRSRINPAKSAPSTLGTFKILVRMIFPLCALSLVMLASYTTLGEPSAFLDGLLGGTEKPSDWLGQGHWILCLSFLVLNLTNRAYGPSFTTTLVFVSWIVLGAVGFYMVNELGPDGLPGGTLPSARVLSAFVVALFLGHLAGVMMFDLTRGPRWYAAPWWGAAGGAALFVILYYGIAHAGTDHPWLNRMGVDLVVKLIMALFMLLPYMALRAAVRPQPGFGGA